MTEAQFWPAGGQRASPLLLAVYLSCNGLTSLSTRVLPMRVHARRAWVGQVHSTRQPRLLPVVCVPGVPSVPVCLCACVPDCLFPFRCEIILLVSRSWACSAADCSRPIIARLDVVKMTAGTPLLSAIEEMMVRLAGPDYKIVFACHSDPLKTEPVHHVPSFETADRR